MTSCMGYSKKDTYMGEVMGILAWECAWECHLALPFGGKIE